MQRSWDATEVEENLTVIQELAEVLKKYPNLILRIKSICDGSGQNDQVTQAAFAKDFEADFPTEAMDKSLPYAHARALTIQRMPLSQPWACFGLF